MLNIKLLSRSSKSTVIMVCFVIPELESGNYSPLPNGLLLVSSKDTRRQESRWNLLLPISLLFIELNPAMALYPISNSCSVSASLHSQKRPLCTPHPPLIPAVLSPQSSPSSNQDPVPCWRVLITPTSPKGDSCCLCSLCFPWFFSPPTPI